MIIIECLKRLLPDWKGSVWNNDYNRIIPNETETRPIPTLKELEAVWTAMEEERITEEKKAAAKVALAEIDLSSIRPIREYIIGTAEVKEKAVAALSTYETKAIAEREKMTMLAGHD